MVGGHQTYDTVLKGHSVRKSMNHRFNFLSSWEEVFYSGGNCYTTALNLIKEWVPLIGAVYDKFTYSLPRL